MFKFILKDDCKYIHKEGEKHAKVHTMTVGAII